MSNDSDMNPPPSPRPPKGPGLLTILIVLAVGALMFLAGVKWAHRSQAPAGTEESATQAGDEHGHHQYWTCGMHPWVILPNPGDCPICHMKLVPLDPAKFSTEVAISPQISQDIGIRVAPVESGPVTSVIRTVGNVDYNETLVRDVNLKIAGWVEKLHVDYVGKPVKAGDPLLEIYSPELVTAQEEYLNAFRSRSTAPASGAATDTWDRELQAAARKRLQNFDISDEQIAQLEKSGKVGRTMTLRSPFSGLVVAKNVNEGMKVEAGMQLFRIADLSKVWIMATLYEYQIPFVSAGQKAGMTLPYIPGVTFEGKVAYIYPYLNPELHQVKVRLEFDNPDLVLKPGMYANVELRSTLAQDRILVPRQAVIDTGSRQVAFVSLGGGRFDPRAVRLGVEAQDGKVVVLDGLRQGEMVVTSGTFLLDSEARLREALAKMVRGDMAAGQSQAAQLGASELDSLSDDVAKQLVAMMDDYFAIGNKLSHDTIEGLPTSARALASGADALVGMQIAGRADFWTKHVEIADIRGRSLELVSTKDIARARELFADLSIAMEKLLKSTGVPPAYQKEVQALHCPMYREGQGGTWWLQPAGDVQNPYYGKMMLQCKDQAEAIPVTGKGALTPPATAPAAPAPSMPPMPGM